MRESAAAEMPASSMSLMDFVNHMSNFTSLSAVTHVWSSGSDAGGAAGGAPVLTVDARTGGDASQAFPMTPSRQMLTSQHVPFLAARTPMKCE